MDESSSLRGELFRKYFLIVLGNRNPYFGYKRFLTKYFGTKGEKSLTQDNCNRKERYILLAMP